MLRVLFLLGCLALNMQMAFCSTPESQETIDIALKNTSSEPSIFTILFSLFFVIALIYVTGVIYSRLNVVAANTVKKQMKNYDLSKVVILTTTQLGPNKNLHVVELNKKKFLIGATPNSINLIRELDWNEDEETAFDKAGEAADSEEEAEEAFDLHKKYL